MTQPHSPTACPLCGSLSNTPHLQKYGHSICRCNDCGHIHVNPMPSDEALTAHYQDLSYFEGADEQGYKSYADMHRALKPHFERRLSLLKSKAASGNQLLDFGCADGYFLSLAKKHGWRISGVELSSEMAARASKELGVSIDQAIPDRFGAYDVMTMWEVIEHMPRPIEHLRRLIDLLKPGGVLALSTPNTEHWQAVRSHDKWVSYRPPSHLQYFTESTLSRSLSAAGFCNVVIQQTMPLPPMPNWLTRATGGLYRNLSLGQARDWAMSLWLWRATRLIAWGWQKMRYPKDNVFTTLEAVAQRPS